MDEHTYKNDFDFIPIGLAIMEAREAKGFTREAFAEMVGISARHLQAVEKEGQRPSFELFIQLVTMLDVSVDSYIFLEKTDSKSSLRRRIDTLLDTFGDRELTIIEWTAKGICKAKEPEE